MKHLEVKHLWLQDAYRQDDYVLDTVKSEDNVDDGMTKRLAICYLCDLLGLRTTDGNTVGG
eukprot:10639262-Heterocapsa_arctica.AAC.1